MGAGDLLLAVLVALALFLFGLFALVRTRTR